MAKFNMPTLMRLCTGMVMLKPSSWPLEEDETGHWLGGRVIFHLIGAGEFHSWADCRWLRHCPLAQNGCYSHRGDPPHPRKNSCCPSNEESILLGASRRRGEGPAPPPAAAHVSTESLLERVKHLCWHRWKGGRVQLWAQRRQLATGCNLHAALSVQTPPSPGVWERAVHWRLLPFWWNAHWPFTNQLKVHLCNILRYWHTLHC